MREIKEIRKMKEIKEIRKIKEIKEINKTIKMRINECDRKICNANRIPKKNDKTESNL